MRRSSLIAVPLKRPEDVIPHLGKPSHWEQGRSAKSLADIWFRAKGIPASVHKILGQSEDLAQAQLLEGWLERETDLQDGRATPSQSDLMALLAIKDRLAVLCVESKVDESFGPFVFEWLESDSAGKRERLARLCARLRLDAADIGHLRYQLLHRTAAAIIEAQRFRTDTAIVLIQSFCPKATGLADAAAFFEAIGFSGFMPGKLLGPKRFDGVDLWVGWVSDSVIPSLDGAVLNEI